MKLTPKTVSDTIKGWSIMYPSANRSNAQEAFIAKEFFEDLRGVFSDEAFKLAAKKVKRHCKFFPTIADMFGVKDEVYLDLERQKVSSVKKLSEYTDQNTEQEKKDAIKRLAIIRQVIDGKLTTKEAEEQMQSLIGYAK